MKFKNLKADAVWTDVNGQTHDVILSIPLGEFFTNNNNDLLDVNENNEVTLKLIPDENGTYCDYIVKQP